VRVATVLHAHDSVSMALQFGPEDQQNINTFSKVNTQLHELDAMMSIQQVSACRP
jgi:hypothetical protein